MKEGNIILLTRRKGSLFNLRNLVSYLIAYFSIKDTKDIDKVATHSAIVYKEDDEFYVRDMDMRGVVRYKFIDYLAIFNDRIKVKENPFESPSHMVDFFNNECITREVTYEFKNTLFFQLIKVMTGRFLGKDTLDTRSCSEDTARLFNCLKYWFWCPESIAPSDIDLITKEWKTVYPTFREKEELFAARTQTPPTLPEESKKEGTNG